MAEQSPRSSARRHGKAQASDAIDKGLKLGDGEVVVADPPPGSRLYPNSNGTSP